MTQSSQFTEQNAGEGRNSLKSGFALSQEAQTASVVGDRVCGRRKDAIATPHLEFTQICFTQTQGHKNTRMFINTEREGKRKGEKEGGILSKTMFC